MVDPIISFTSWASDNFSAKQDTACWLSSDDEFSGSYADGLLRMRSSWGSQRSDGTAWMIGRGASGDLGRCFVELCSWAHPHARSGWGSQHSDAELEWLGVGLLETPAAALSSCARGLAFAVVVNASIQLLFICCMAITITIFTTVWRMLFCCATLAFLEWCCCFLCFDWNANAISLQLAEYLENERNRMLCCNIHPTP